MRLGFLFVAIVLCGFCSGIPTDGTSTSAVATASASTAASTSPNAAPVASSGGSSSATAAAGGLQDFDDDDDDDDEESQINGGGLSVPLSSAILLNSHHGHHVCLPDVVAFSLLGSRGYPISTLLPLRHTTSQRLQQELMFLKAFTKAGQHVWNTIASGHGKHPYQGFNNIAKMAGSISSGINMSSGKGGPGGITSGLPSVAQNLAPPLH